MTFSLAPATIAVIGAALAMLGAGRAWEAASHRQALLMANATCAAFWFFAVVTGLAAVKVIVPIF